MDDGSRVSENLDGWDELPDPAWGPEALVIFCIFLFLALLLFALGVSGATDPGFAFVLGIMFLVPAFLFGHFVYDSERERRLRKGGIQREHPLSSDDTIAAVEGYLEKNHMGFAEAGRATRSLPYSRLFDGPGSLRLFENEIRIAIHPSGDSNASHEKVWIRIVPPHPGMDTQVWDLARDLDDELGSRGL